MGTRLQRGEHDEGMDGGLLFHQHLFFVFIVGLKDGEEVLSLGEGGSMRGLNEGHGLVTVNQHDGVDD